MIRIGENIKRLRLEKMRERFMNGYSLSGEFKASEEFKRIIGMLE